MFNFIITLDKNIAIFINALEKPQILNDIFIFITTLGNTAMIWIAIIIILLIRKETRRVAVLMAIALIIDYILVDLSIKPLVARLRPFLVVDNIKMLLSKTPESFSFPSGHTASSFACAMTYYYNKRKSAMAFVLIGLAILISLSRIYLCVHFLSDVVAGAALGILIAWAVHAVARKYAYN